MPMTTTHALVPLAAALAFVEPPIPWRLVIVAAVASAASYAGRGGGRDGKSRPSRHNDGFSSASRVPVAAELGAAVRRVATILQWRSAHGAPFCPDVDTFSL